MGKQYKEKSKTLTRISQSDDRPSSAVVGYTTVTIVAVLFSLIVLIDILTFLRHCDNCCPFKNKGRKTPSKSFDKMPRPLTERLMTSSQKINSLQIKDTVQEPINAIETFTSLQHQQKLSHFENYSIYLPTDDHNHLFRNDIATFDIRNFRYAKLLAASNRIKEEGDTVGLNMGEMMLMTRDLGILKQVMVKDFNNYVDRSILIVSNSPMAKSVFFLGGQDSEDRHLITPSFRFPIDCSMDNFSSNPLFNGQFHSTSITHGTSTHIFKIARLDYIILKVQVKITNELKDDLVPIKHVMGQFTGEIIARTAFSLKTDCIGHARDDEFTKYSKEIFKVMGRFMNFIMLILFQCRWLHKLLVKKLKIQLFDSVDEEANQYFLSILNNTIEDRRQIQKSGKKAHTDLFQNLLYAQEVVKEKQT
ncbi:hypothetical protein Btru_052075 [Bulinus truncatus]|nr:hypothetical protein Btru_052075 [Bulinus truncatus]